MSVKKTIVFQALAIGLLASVVLADEAQPTVPQVIAGCNVQFGQTLASLGQTQQQVIALQAQLADAQKQIADLKAAAKK